MDQDFQGNCTVRGETFFLHVFIDHTHGRKKKGRIVRIVGKSIYFISLKN